MRIFNLVIVTASMFILTGSAFHVETPKEQSKCPFINKLTKSSCPYLDKRLNSKTDSPEILKKNYNKCPYSDKSKGKFNSEQKIYSDLKSI